MNQQYTTGLATWLQSRYPQIDVRVSRGALLLRYKHKTAYIETFTPNATLEQAKTFVDSLGIENIPPGLFEAVSASLQREIDTL